MLCLLTAVLTAGCGSAGKEFADNGGSGLLSDVGNESYEYRGEISDGYYDMDEGMDFESSEDGWTQTAGQEESFPVSDGRKLITTVSLDVETKEFETAMSALEKRIQEMGGYVENLNNYNGSRYSGSGSSRYADMTVRIPQERLKEFLAAVPEVSNVVRRSENVEDVTLSYVDMESRRNTLRTEQSRLLEFLDRAETVEEIIAIEERLSNVRYQLESMESQLRAMDNRVDYATVHLNISEVQELTPAAEQTFWDRTRDGFMDSLEEIRDGAENLAVWLLSNIPYIAVWAVLLGIVIVILRAWRRKKNQRKSAAVNQINPSGNGPADPPMQ